MGLPTFMCFEVSSYQANNFYAFVILLLKELILMSYWRSQGFLSLPSLSSHLQLVTKVYKDELELETYLKSDHYAACSEVK